MILTRPAERPNCGATYENPTVYRSPVVPTRAAIAGSRYSRKFGVRRGLIHPPLKYFVWIAKCPCPVPEPDARHCKCANSCLCGAGPSFQDISNVGSDRNDKHGNYPHYCDPCNCKIQPAYSTSAESFGGVINPRNRLMSKYPPPKQPAAVKRSYSQEWIGQRCISE